MVDLTKIPRGQCGRTTAIKPGLEVLTESHLRELAGKRIGLVANPTSVTCGLTSALEVLASEPSVNLTVLFGPQHGLRGEAQAGEYVPLYKERKYDLPVFSLYGQSLEPASDGLKNIDSLMRSFDVTDRAKIPSDDIIRQADLIIFDIQDVGTRIYTYIATMAYVMRACARCGVEFMVLDRPNPITGLTVEGPVLDFPEFSSFVGLYPIPVRHAMTMGELAKLFNAKYLKKPARLTVVPMQGWKRDLWFDQTGLPWIYPSPNIPVLDTAVVYPGQVFLEGTNISEGRGTTKPFELFGAPWIDGARLAEALNGLELEGVCFREAWFRPVFSKFRGKLCGGCQIHVTDRDRFRPYSASLHIIQMIRRHYPERFQFHKAYFDQIMGTKKIRKQLEKCVSVEHIKSGCEKDLNKFLEVRKPYLLYG